MKKWYSVRMRSSKGGSHENGGQHISGAERLVAPVDLEATTTEMIRRATMHTRGEADFISLKIESIQPSEIQYILPLCVKQIINESHYTTKKVLQEQLVSSPIPQELLFSLYDWIIQDNVTRGAAVIDINSGKRMDPMIDRGVRVSHFDWDKEFKDKWSTEKLGVYNERRAEAIALASKVAAAGTICEICCSDDPEYTTGYLTYQHNFIRIPNMKQKNSPYGGRVFFVDAKKLDIDEYIHYLEKTPVFIGGIS